MTYKCGTCGKENGIVNQCRCDPNNLPTKLWAHTDGVWSTHCFYGHIVRVSARVQPTLGVDVHCLECDLQEGGAV